MMRLVDVSLVFSACHVDHLPALFFFCLRHVAWRQLPECPATRAPVDCLCDNKLVVPHFMYTPLLLGRRTSDPPMYGMPKLLSIVEDGHALEVEAWD